MFSSRLATYWMDGHTSDLQTVCKLGQWFFHQQKATKKWHCKCTVCLVAVQIMSPVKYELLLLLY